MYTTLKYDFSKSWYNFLHKNHKCTFSYLRKYGRRSVLTCIHILFNRLYVITDVCVVAVSHIWTSHPQELLKNACGDCQSVPCVWVPVVMWHCYCHKSLEIRATEKKQPWLQWCVEVPSAIFYNILNLYMKSQVSIHICRAWQTQ